MLAIIRRGHHKGMIMRVFKYTHNAFYFKHPEDETKTLAVYPTLLAFTKETIEEIVKSDQLDVCFMAVPCDRFKKGWWTFKKLRNVVAL